jgi:hypothetical protein
MGSDASPRWARWGRAAFVALHLFAVTYMAMPSAGSGLTRSAWADPTVQNEFASWTERLNGWGIAIAQDDLEDRLWAIASGYEDVRLAILSPFEPYFEYCGTWQSWRMFVAPHRYPGRLEIDVDHGRGWEPLYVARSNEHDWHRTQLDHDRSRAAIFRYSWKHYRTHRRHFTDWVATQVMAEDPEAQKVRVSWMRYRTPSAADVLAGKKPKEKRDLSNVRDLRTLRREAGE